MTEARIGKERMPSNNFRRFQAEFIKRELQPFPEVSSWIAVQKERFKPIEARLGNAPVTGENWSAEYIRNDRQEIVGVEKITNSGNAFSIEGISGLPWHQTGIKEGTVRIVLQTPEGKIESDVSGFVGVVQDRSGNVLIAGYQGPFMNTENNLVIRTPLQTAAGKFAAMQSGDSTKDPIFNEVLTFIYGSENPFEKFLQAIAAGEVAVWPFAAVNENRILATNIGVKIVVDDALKEGLTKDGIYKWANKEEISVLSRTGLLNTVAASAFVASS